MPLFWYQLLFGWRINAKLHCVMNLTDGDQLRWNGIKISNTSLHSDAWSDRLLLSTIMVEIWLWVEDNLFLVGILWELRVNFQRRCHYSVLESELVLIDIIGPQIGGGDLRHGEPTRFALQLASQFRVQNEYNEKWRSEKCISWLFMLEYFIWACIWLSLCFMSLVGLEQIDYIKLILTKSELNIK